MKNIEKWHSKEMIKNQIRISYIKNKTNSCTDFIFLYKVSQKNTNQYYSHIFTMPKVEKF